MQQRGGDQGTGRARGRGERPGLQQVLRDGDRLAQVVRGSLRREQPASRSTGDMIVDMRSLQVLK